MKTEPDTENLFEGGYLNLTGKILLASLGAWLVGKVVNTKLRGNQDEITAVSNALMASRRFQDELHKPGASVQSVIEKLHIKQMSAAEFERVLGVPWPL
jgi:predicted sulfurtransferase